MMTTPQPGPQQWYYGPPSGAGPQPPAPRPRRAWPWVAGGVAVLAVGAIVAALLLSAGTVQMRGEVVGTAGLSTQMFRDASGFYPGESGECAGHGQWSDIRGGAVVTVLDSTGQIVGTTQLRAGTGAFGECTFGFDVAELPASDFYRVQVANREPVTWTLDEVLGENGIRLTVGS